MTESMSVHASSSQVLNLSKNFSCQFSPAMNKLVQPVAVHHACSQIMPRKGCPPCKYNLPNVAQTKHGHTLPDFWGISSSKLANPSAQDQAMPLKCLGLCSWKEAM